MLVLVLQRRHDAMFPEVQVHIPNRDLCKMVSMTRPNHFFPSDAFLRLRRKKALIRVRNRRDFENSL